MAPMVSYIKMSSERANITSGCQIAVRSRYQKLRDQRLYCYVVLLGAFHLAVPPSGMSNKCRLGEVLNVQSMLQRCTPVKRQLINFSILWFILKY